MRKAKKADLTGDCGLRAVRTGWFEGRGSDRTFARAHGTHSVFRIQIMFSNLRMSAADKYAVVQYLGLIGKVGVSRHLIIPKTMTTVVYLN